MSGSGGRSRPRLPKSPESSPRKSRPETRAPLRDGASPQPASDQALMLIFMLMGFAVVALAHTAPAPFVLDTMAGDRAVWHMPRGLPSTVYLTYDDGPNPTTTPDLLDVLAREQVRATFFLIDPHVTDETAPIVRRMLAEGHAIGLHSATRADMLLSPEALGQKLTAAANRIESLGGTPPCRAFRPHAGWRGGEMYERAQEDRLQAGRLGLDALGLELAPRTHRGQHARANLDARVGRRHHRHARRGRIGAAEGTAANSGGDGAPDFRFARSRIRLRNSLPERVLSGRERKPTASPTVGNVLRLRRNGVGRSRAPHDERERCEAGAGGKGAANATRKRDANARRARETQGAKQHDVDALRRTDLSGNEKEREPGELAGRLEQERAVEARRHLAHTENPPQLDHQNRVREGLEDQNLGEATGLFAQDAHQEILRPPHSVRIHAAHGG